MSGSHRLTTGSCPPVGKLGSWEHVSPIFGRHQGGVSEDFTDICFFGTRSSENTHFHHNLPKTLSFFR